jgi:phage terminase small subunit
MSETQEADIDPRRWRGTVITPKQQTFIAEYIRDKNGTRAAAAAGYKQPANAAAALLDPQKYPMVARAIKESLAETRKACEIEAHRVVQELARIAFLNPKQLLDDEGNLLDLSEMSDDVAACIKEIKVSYKLGRGDRGQKIRVKTVEVKFWDKLNACRQIAQHLGLLKDTINVNNVVVRWDDLFSNMAVPDEIEERIMSAERGLPYNPEVAEGDEP